MKCRQPRPTHLHQSRRCMKRFLDALTGATSTEPILRALLRRNKFKQDSRPTICFTSYTAHVKASIEEYSTNCCIRFEYFLSMFLNLAVVGDDGGDVKEKEVPGLHL